MQSPTTGAGDELSDEQAAAVERMTDASMVFHRFVRLMNDAAECICLALAVYGQYAALHAANRELQEVNNEEPAA